MSSDCEKHQFSKKSLPSLSSFAVTYPPQERFLRESPAALLARDPRRLSDDSDHVCVIALKGTKSAGSVRAFSTTKGESQSRMSEPIHGDVLHSVI